MSKKPVTDKIDALKLKITNNNSISSGMQTSLLKDIEGIQKSIKPKREKRVGESHFTKKFNVTKEMANFAEWDEDSTHSRGDITKAISAYYKKQNLQDPKNGTIIHLDDTLKNLLKITQDVITFPNIQKHTGQHLLKSSEVNPSE